jgi:hypothetical protein
VRGYRVFRPCRGAKIRCALREISDLQAGRQFWHLTGSDLRRRRNRTQNSKLTYLLATALTDASDLNANGETHTRPQAPGHQSGWRLPEEIEHPEGLVLLDGLTPLVADDRPEAAGGPNLFLLSTLSR